MAEKESTRVFISYSRRDSDAAMALRAALIQVAEERALPLSVWVDLDVLPGDHIIQAIASEISQSDAIVILVSKNLLASQSVHTEIALAVSERLKSDKQVIPILLSDTSDLPPLLANTLAIDGRQRDFPRIAHSVVTAIQTKRKLDRNSIVPSDTDILNAIEKLSEEGRRKFALSLAEEQRRYSSEIASLYAGGACALLATVVMLSTYSFDQSELISTIRSTALGVLTTILGFTVGYAFAGSAARKERRGARGDAS